MLSFSIYYILYRNLCQKKEEKSIIDRINRYSDLLNRLLPESCLVWCGEWPAGRIEPNRRLYDYELVYVAGGKGYVATGEESHYCEAGSLLVIPPGVVHFSRAETRIRRWCIHFDWYGECLAQRKLEHPYLFLDDEAAYREELAAAPPPPELGLVLPCHIRLGVEKREPFLELLRAFFTEVPDCPAAAVRRRGLLWEILAHTLEQPAAGALPRNINTLFFQAKCRLDREFRDPALEVGEIARSLRITPNHLLKLFRRETGMPTQDYLILRRLRHAENLLLSTRLSIGEIAEQSGFLDANYFARLFRRRHGCTPREFRSGSPPFRD